MIVVFSLRFEVESKGYHYVILFTARPKTKDTCFFCIFPSPADSPVTTTEMNPEIVFKNDWKITLSFLQ